MKTKSPRLEPYARIQQAGFDVTASYVDNSSRLRVCLVQGTTFVQCIKACRNGHNTLAESIRRMREGGWKPISQVYKALEQLADLAESSQFDVGLAEARARETADKQAFEVAVAREVESRLRVR